MSLSERIAKLEHATVSADEIPGLVFLSVVDSSLGADDTVTQHMAIVPGDMQRHGVTLKRLDAEAQESFVSRAKEYYNIFWGLEKK